MQLLSASLCVLLVNESSHFFVRRGTMAALRAHTGVFTDSNY